MTTLNEDLTPKIIEFQHEVIPKAKTIAVLFDPVNPTNPVYVDKLRSAASAIGITVLPVELKSRETLDAVFSTIVAQHPDALHLVS